MRLAILAIVAVLSVGLPSRASAQASLSAFGALPVNNISSFGDSGFPIDFGGRVSFEIAPGLHALGEFGRLGNVLPDLVAVPLSFSPVDVRVSAFYGEGGLRLLAAPNAAVSPYVEGTAGMAHLRLGVNGLGSTTDAIVRSALNFVDSREPMIGGGGGLLLRGGALQVDLGYRYKRILGDGLFSSIVSAGQDLRSHQVRVGFGVRF